MTHMTKGRVTNRRVAEGLLAQRLLVVTEELPGEELLYIPHWSFMGYPGLEEYQPTIVITWRGVAVPKQEFYI